ncbi:hypothetical protein VPH35_032345 [Triticum aestivum]
MAYPFSSSAATAAGAVLLPVGHPTSRSSSGGRLLSFAASEDRKVSALASRGNGLVAVAVPEGATGGWGFLQASTTKGSPGSGLLALALPVGATGGWSLLQANTTEMSRGDVLTLALPAGGWDLLSANKTAALVALAETALPANKTTSRGLGLVSLAEPAGGWGDAPGGAGTAGVEFANGVEKIGSINSYVLIGHPEILKVAAEAAERCIHVVEPYPLIESATADSLRLVEDCRFVIAECREGYVRKRPLLDALYHFKMLSAGFIDLGGVPDTPKPFITITPSPTEAEKVAYFKGVAEEFEKLTRIVESRFEEWISSGKSSGWYEWSVISSYDDE